MEGRVRVRAEWQKCIRVDKMEKGRVGGSRMCSLR
jgi:hypothetical protein